MKKRVLAALTLLCLFGTATAQRHLEYKWRGYYGVLEFAYGFNVNRGAGINGAADTASLFAMTFSSGFQFSKETGVGLGVSYISDPEGAYTQMPIFVELRSHFSRARLTPYTAIQAGYSLPVGASSEPPIRQITEGGLYFGIDLGGRYAITRNVAVSGHVGYKLLQSNKFKRYMPGGDSLPFLEDPLVLHMIFVGAGVHF